MDGTTHKAVLANGLHDVRGKLLFLDAGVAQKGFIFVNGYNYHFNDKDGSADKGWVTNGKDKYYYDLKTCQGYIGWKTVEGKERYFYDDSKMAVNTTIDGKEIVTRWNGSKQAGRTDTNTVSEPTPRSKTTGRSKAAGRSRTNTNGTDTRSRTGKGRACRREWKALLLREWCKGKWLANC